MRINEKSYMNLAKKIQAMLEEEIERNTVTDQTKHVQHTVRISKKFMRLPEAAEYYSISINKLRQLAKEGQAFYKVDKVVLVNTEVLDRYLETFKTWEE